MPEQNPDELTRRHRAAATIVSALITLVLALIALAYAGVRPNAQLNFINPTMYASLWIVILFIGLGAIAYRRMKFNALRLETIAAYKGADALLATLQKTTIYVALFGVIIAAIGYLLFMRSGDASDMLKAGIIAVAILLYTYPRRAAWRQVWQATKRPGGLTDDDAPPAPVKGTLA